MAYPIDTYTELSLQSLDLWRDIEKENGVERIRMTGELDFAPARNDDIRGVEGVDAVQRAVRGAERDASERAIPWLLPESQQPRGGR